MTKTSFFGKMGSFFGLEDDEEFSEQSFTEQPRRSTPKTTPIPRQKVVVPKTSGRQKGQAPMPNVMPQQQSRPQTRVQEQTQATGRKSTRTEKKVVPIQSERRSARPQGAAKDSSSTIMVLEPRVYSEAMSIAKHVMSGKSVLVNFHLMEEHQARRIVDFLTGTVYAEDGDIKRVSDEMFLCTPKTVEIEGTANSLAQSEMFDLNEMSL
ncbi:cell division protein SepF [Enterococcus sp. LJL98]